MSYNTRRGGGGRSHTTQVNYHQQQPKPGSNNSQQTRNPGYLTKSSNYTSSQPAYSTQQPQKPAAKGPAVKAPATQTPEAKAPVMQTTADQTLAAKQPATQTPAAKQPVTTSIESSATLSEKPVDIKPAIAKSTVPQTSSAPVKLESTNNDETPEIEMEVSETQNGEGSSAKPFFKKKPYVKLSNKVKRARQNAKLKRVLNPKNALTFLNELRPGGVKFTVNEEPGWGFVASIDIDGKTFKGNGLSISKAKIQASEQALKNILMDQISKSQNATIPVKEEKKEEEMRDEEQEVQEGDEPRVKRQKIAHPEDDMPWGSLAAFALHKLLEDWQKEGETPPAMPPPKKYEEMNEDLFYRRPAPPPDMGFPRRFGPGSAMFNRRGQPPMFPPRGGNFNGPPRRLLPSPASTYLANAARPLMPVGGGGAPLNTTMAPMKKIPEDANKRNPVMLLNQLKPHVIYNEALEGEPPRANFRVTVILDGEHYIGRGKNKKEAKKNASIVALLSLGIVHEGATV